MNTHCHCTNPVTPEPDCPAHGFNRTRTTATIEPGEGWYILPEGTPLQPGDGFKHPVFASFKPGLMWIDYECRPDTFRDESGGSATVHSMPWRRRTPAEAPAVDPYPEHTKLQAVKELSQACGEFIDWLQSEKRIVLAGYGSGRESETLCPNYTPMNFLLAQHFGIDARKLETEKQAMIEEMRKGNAQ